MINLYQKDLWAPLDLSVDNADLESVNNGDQHALDRYIHSVREHSGRQILVGGYLEQRSIYRRSKHFDQAEDIRDIHLGMDIWAPADTPVAAIADGIIHSYANNIGLGNYGPTIIVHHPKQDVYSLYGHLSKSSIEGISMGAAVQADQVIGHLGGPDVNGDYPPHLHLQIIKDLEGWKGDYPGVCSAADVDHYAANCPDPTDYI